MSPPGVADMWPRAAYYRGDLGQEYAQPQPRNRWLPLGPSGLRTVRFTAPGQDQQMHATFTV
jgi:hypothetical protein